MERHQTVTNGSQTATYVYYSASGLLNTTTFTSGIQTSRSYDSLGRLQTMTTSTPAVGVAASYTYVYNNLNQRTRVTREDNSYWLYSYNDRGELVSGKKYWADNAPVWGTQTENNFDNIGNRNYAKNGGNQLGTLRQSNYTTNSLNQYSQASVPGAIDVTGTANSAATVTVNNQATARKNNYFYKELAVDNNSGPAYAQINVVGARNNFGAGGEDAVTEKGGRLFVPQAAETFSYDFDGNLTSDGRWVYSWDGENRLLGIEATANVPVEAKSRLEFAYDYVGRRVQKKVYSWNTATSSYQLQATTKFVNSGWNLVAELDGSGALIRSYVWSVGELLLINGGGSTYEVGSDGNENVATVVKAGTGLISASYEYDLFGNTLKSTGEYATGNPFKFSTKYADQESGLIYYGFRYYGPSTGRWLGRDPIEESGGLNLYAMLSNNPVDHVDPLGLQSRRSGKRPKAPEACKCCCVEDLDIVTSGDFRGGLSLTDYYPFLSGKVEFISREPSKAGPFEDRPARGRPGSTRIGVKVQIVSKVKGPGEQCNFSQHFWVGAEVVGGGFPRHQRGVNIDDINTPTVTDQSKPPFRQYIDGNPSMADPVSVESQFPSNVEFWYTTCLNSGGEGVEKNCKKKQCCVKWRARISINSSGKIIEHAVTKESNWCW